MRTFYDTCSSIIVGNWLKTVQCHVNVGFYFNFSIFRKAKSTWSSNNTYIDSVKKNKKINEAFKLRTNDEVSVSIWWFLHFLADSVDHEGVG